MKKKLVHQWKEQARISVDPELAAAELQKIKKTHRRLTPEIVVQDVRKNRKTSVLADYFEWDDKKAAHKYRVEQAKYLIRMLEVNIIVDKGDEVEKSVKVRKYASVGGGRGYGKKSEYEDIRVVMSDAELKRELLMKVWNQLLSLKQQYEDLTELSEVWYAIAKVHKKMVDIAGLKKTA